MGLFVPGAVAVTANPPPWLGAICFSAISAERNSPFVRIDWDHFFVTSAPPTKALSLARNRSARKSNQSPDP